jgi:tRNA uridine 5-carboxymethylaminomethyl modification enzyme
MTAETETKYAGYLEQQKRQIERLLGSDARAIPDTLQFELIPGISREVSERLTRVRPVTLGQASRIPGVTAAAVAILDVYLNLTVSRETLV